MFCGWLILFLCRSTNARFFTETSGLAMRAYRSLLPEKRYLGDRSPGSTRADLHRLFKIAAGALKRG
jgi:hypothetical protein